MSSSVEMSQFRQRTASLESARASLDAPRAAHADEAKAQLETASLHAQDAASYYTTAGRTAWYGLREAGQSTWSAAVGAAHMGAAVGFAAAGVVAKGATAVSRTVVGGFARGFLALSNVLARSLGQKAATRQAAPASGKPSFAQRMFARAKANFSSSKQAMSASGRGFVDATKVGVLGTAANFTLGSVSTARASTRLAVAGWHGAIASSFYGAQTALTVTRGAVTGAERAALRARDATLRIAESAANAAGQEIVVA